MSPSPSVTRSRALPSLSWNMILPPAMRPGGLAMSRMRARPVTDLPDPDSPTMTRVSPLAMLKERPSTAVRTPASVANSTFRSSTVRSGCVWLGGSLSLTRGIGSGAAPARVEKVAKRVAEEVEADHYGKDREAGKGRDPPGGEEI